MEIQDPLVQHLGDIAGEDADYVEMLSHIENQTKLKNLPENSEVTASLDWSWILAPDWSWGMLLKHWSQNLQEQN